MLFVSLMFVGVGILLAGLAVPLVRRRVPPNPIYGLRVPATFADEGVWYDANQRSGHDLLALGVALAGLALALPAVPGLSVGAFGLIMAGLALTGAITLAVVGAVRANRMLRERRER